SVYALPSSDQAQEDLQWVLREIAESGGEGSICESRFVDGLSGGQGGGLFNTARDPEDTMILKEARAARCGAGGAAESASVVERLRRRLATLTAIDFFGAPGRLAAESAVSELERRAQSADDESERKSAGEARAIDLSGGRTWVTRRGIHVDRMASAWLIRRFIDPAARFKFVSARGYEPEKGELRFDMFEAEFTHEGDRCTFEVLLQRLKLTDAALRPIGEIFEYIDLNDSQFV